jgi:hypothetical protein
MNYTADNWTGELLAEIDHGMQMCVGQRPSAGNARPRESDGWKQWEEC